MTTKFTPGPYSRHPFGNATLRSCTSEMGTWQYAETVIGSGDKIVARVELQTHSGGYAMIDNVEEMEATANLFLAAPDLFQYAQSSAQNGCATARALVAKVVGDTDKHRGWTISHNPPPIPVRDFDWCATGPDFDASYEGEEDGWVGNGESVSASTYDDLIEEIDNWFDEQAACKACSSTDGWYTSYSGGFAHPLPCEHCNPNGLSRDTFVAQVAA